MTEVQKELNENRKRNLKKFAELLPDVLKQVGDQANLAYKDRRNALQRPLL